MSKKVLIILTITLISILFLTGCLGKEFKQIEPSPLDELNQEDTGIESVIGDLDQNVAIGEGLKKPCDEDRECIATCEGNSAYYLQKCVNNFCEATDLVICDDESGKICKGPPAKCISDDEILGGSASSGTFSSMSLDCTDVPTYDQGSPFIYGETKIWGDCNKVTTEALEPTTVNAVAASSYEGNRYRTFQSDTICERLDNDLRTPGPGISFTTITEYSNPVSEGDGGTYTQTLYQGMVCEKSDGTIAMPVCSPDIIGKTFLRTNCVAVQANVAGYSEDEFRRLLAIDEIEDAEWRCVTKTLPYPGIEGSTFPTAVCE